MNTYFDKLSDIKNTFQNNLDKKSEHSLSNGLLQNFGKVFSDNSNIKDLRLDGLTKLANSYLTNKI